MRVESPLARIAQVLGKAKESASTYHDTLRSNEDVTRAVLIDPVLRSLGWDTANPYMVEVEKQYADGRVDYSLTDANGETCAIIEAKRLGTNLLDQRVFLSVVGYAFSAKVHDVFLTDGIVWHHYQHFDPKSAAPAKVLDLASGSVLDAAAYLVNALDAARFWPEQGDVDEIAQQVRQLEADLAAVRSDLARIQASAPTVISPPPFPLGPAKPTAITERFVALEDIPNATGTKPTSLRLPDDTIVPVKSWNELLRECVKATLDRNPGIAVPLKDRAGKKVELISLARPPKGIGHIQLQYAGKTVFIYTNYDATNCVLNASHVLTFFPKDQMVVTPAAAYA